MLESSDKKWTWEELAKVAIAANTADWRDEASKAKCIAELHVIKRKLMLGDTPDCTKQ